MRGEVCRALRTTEFTLTETVDTRREQRRVLAGTVVGTSIEWYDFFIYAQAAGVVLGPLFFAPAGATFAQIVAWASLGISFLSEDARHWYTIAITVDPETGKQLASERVNFPDEVSLMLHDYYAAAQNRQ